MEPRGEAKGLLAGFGVVAPLASGDLIVRSPIDGSLFARLQPVDSAQTAGLSLQPRRPSWPGAKCRRRAAASWFAASPTVCVAKQNRTPSWSPWSVARFAAKPWARSRR